MSGAAPALRVLHVTEAMSTGVLSFLDSITARQVADGAEVSVLYTVRQETPARAALERRFADGVRLLTAIDDGSTLRSVAALARRLRALVRSGSFDVVHLHSSIAGGAGRLAMPAQGPPVFYSPHGFAFLRENSRPLVRAATRWAERVLARRSTLVLTSRTEMDIARDGLRAGRLEYLQSGVSSETIVPRTRREGPLRVVMLGRIAYQKAPWRFAAVAKRLADMAEFVWIGGGDAADRARWIGDAPVTVREWMPHDELERVLEGTDVLLFPTLWEGMSLSLIQAQGRGIPAVTSDIVGNRDTVLDGVTGFVCRDDEQLVEATRRLLSDGELRERMSAAAQQRILDRFTDDSIGADSLAIYRQHGAGARHRSRSGGRSR